jgi:hypothetical protein
MRKLYWFTLLAVLAIIICTLVAAIVYTSLEVISLQNRVDYLLELIDTPRSGTHSGLAETALDSTIVQLHQTFALLCFEVGLLLVSTLVPVFAWRAHTQRKIHRPLFALVAIFFVFISLMQTTTTPTAAIIHYYARVEMQTALDLQVIQGDITPLYGVIVKSAWVCYHVGIVYSTGDWLGGGYYTDYDKGNLLYIESNINGHYSEIAGPEITEGTCYTVEVVQLTTGQGGVGSIGSAAYTNWTIGIDSGERTLMFLAGFKLPSGQAPLAVAGGESIDSENYMGAHFENLWWFTATHFGQWDGSGGSCQTIQDTPYYLTMYEQYYNFSALRSGVHYQEPSPGTDPGGETAREKALYK